MKNNIEHLKAIMNVFIESKTVFTTLDDLMAQYPVQDDDDNDFVHHYLLLIENQFISNKSGVYRYDRFGLISSIGDDNYIFSDAQIRLTAAGHEFYDTLISPSFTERLADFKDQPIEVMKDVGKELITSYLKKKFDIE